MAMLPVDLHGIHAVIYALFDPDEKLDRDAMRRQAAICVAVGAHGIAALGLATEVAKLSEVERRTIMDWAAEDTARRAPREITIIGGSEAEQVAQVRRAESVGADWVILQPPMVGQFSADEYIRFFGRVAGATNLPVAVQNAPTYMGRGLSVEDIHELLGEHPNIVCIKAEGPATDVARLIEATDGRIRVFNGRGGLELADHLRIGCAGLILAPDVIDLAIAAYEAFQDGDEAAAEAGY